jgi:hypothetical protein
MSLRRNQTRSAQNSNGAVAIATETICILRNRAEAPNVRWRSRLAIFEFSPAVSGYF